MKRLLSISNSTNILKITSIAVAFTTAAYLTPEAAQGRPRLDPRPNTFALQLTLDDTIDNTSGNPGEGFFKGAILNPTFLIVPSPNSQLNCPGTEPSASIGCVVFNSGDLNSSLITRSSFSRDDTKCFASVYTESINGVFVETDCNPSDNDIESFYNKYVGGITYQATLSSQDSTSIFQEQFQFSLNSLELEILLPFSDQDFLTNLPSTSNLQTAFDSSDVILLKFLPSDFDPELSTNFGRDLFFSSIEVGNIEDVSAKPVPESDNGILLAIEATSVLLLMRAKKAKKTVK